MNLRLTVALVLLSGGVYAQTPAAPSMVSITGGQFEMGDHHGYVDPSHPSDEVPIHTVAISDFSIGKTTVTVDQYCAYLNSALAKGLVRVSAGTVYPAAGNEPLLLTRQADPYSRIGWDGASFSVLDNRGSHPVTSVMWHGAVTYCNWLSNEEGRTPCYDASTWNCDFSKNGYRLPTEAEWEYAGRGGQYSPYWIFPWGNEMDVTKANIPNSGDPYESGALPWTTPVGFYNGELRRKADFGWPGSQSTYQTSNGANGFGLYDMAGSVWQWCNDWYGQDYYSASPAQDPTGPASGTPMPDGKPYRVLRGGNWYNGTDGHARVSNRDPAYYRGPQDPNHPYYHVGFRVVRRGATTSQTTQTVGLFVNDPRAWEGYTLFAPKHYGSTYLIDNRGRVVHAWHGSKYEPGQAVYLLPNGHLLRPCMVKGPLSSGGGEGGRIEEYDWDGNLVWEFNYYSAEYTQHHDIKPLSNGNILMLVVEKKTYNEAIAAGFNPSRFQPQVQQQGYMLPDSVVEIQPTGPSAAKVVWSWHVWDHLIQDYDSSKANYGNVAAHPELVNPGADGGQIPSFWNHMNSIYYNAALDQIILSVRGNSEAWVIDHSTTTAEAAGHTGGKYGKGGDLLYRWGNPVMYRAGTKSDQKLYQQHDAQWIDPGCPGAGNILVFNNGLGRNYSTADEFTPPVDSGGNYALTAGSAYGPKDFTWSYRANPPSSLYAEAISGAQRLPNGNTLICDGTHGTFIEVTAAGETVWKYVCPVDKTGPLAQGAAIPLDPARAGELMNAVFRVRRYPLDYPGLAGRDLIPGGRVEIDPRPLAAFVSSSSTPVCNQAIGFTDKSGNQPTGWTWTFGDGTTSMEQNPNHVYKAAGIYTVTLTARNSAGSDAISQRLAVSSGQASLTVKAGGAATAELSSTVGNLQAGFASLAITAGQAPYAIAVFSLTHNGRVVSQVGVPASRPTLESRIFVDLRDGNATTLAVNTGLAVANPGTVTANLTFSLRDSSGNLVTTGHGTLAPNGHFARFVNELNQVAPDFILPAGFPIDTRFGSLTISSDQPVSIVPLRLTINQRAEPLLTSTPVADLSSPAPSGAALYFPQLADGDGWRTTIVLLNPRTTTATGRLSVFDDTGSPLEVRNAAGAQASTFSYSIPANGVYVFQTNGTSAPVKVGSAQVVPEPGSAAPFGAGIFSYFSGPTLVMESGVPASLPTTHARIYVDTAGDRSTGVAVINPAEGDLGLTVRAYQTDGVTAAGSIPAPITIKSNGHLAAYTDSLVPGLPANFRGVLDVVGDKPFAALTLRGLFNGRDAIYTAFPVADLTRSAPAPIVFPQIASGGGYRTEVILISAVGASTTRLDCFVEDGSPVSIETLKQD